jgi:hypothetical protein
MQKLCGNGWADDLSEYFNCAEVQKNNGMVAYTAATCAADGETITLGLYADPYCSQDISQYTNIVNWIGEDVDDEEMAHYYKKSHSALAEMLESYGAPSSADPDSVCIPCSAEVSSYLYHLTLSCLNIFLWLKHLFLFYYYSEPSLV